MGADLGPFIAARARLTDRKGIYTVYIPLPTDWGLVSTRTRACVRHESVQQQSGVIPRPPSLSVDLVLGLA